MNLNSDTALVVIDVQMGAFDGKKISPIENAQEFIDTLCKYIGAFRVAGLPIIYIQDCGKAGGAFEKGSEHWPFHPAIAPLDHDIVIQKSSGNAFEKTELKERLDLLGTKNIVIVGLHSEKCVTETALQGVTNHFQVIVPEDGHCTISSNGISFVEKIKRQNTFFQKNGIWTLNSESLELIQ